jgi:hypothetical protein
MKENLISSRNFKITLNGLKKLKLLLWIWEKLFINNKENSFIDGEIML